MWVQNGHSNTFFKVHPAAALLVNPWPQNNTKYQEQQQADSVKDCGLSPAGQVRLGAGRVRTGTSDNSEITFWKQNTITRHDPNCHHRYLTSRAIIVSLSACLWPFLVPCSRGLRICIDRMLRPILHRKQYLLTLADFL